MGLENAQIWQKVMWNLSPEIGLIWFLKWPQPRNFKGTQPWDPCQGIAPGPPSGP